MEGGQTSSNSAPAGNSSDFVCRDDLQKLPRAGLANILFSMVRFANCISESVLIFSRSSSLLLSAPTTRPATKNRTHPCRRPRQPSGHVLTKLCRMLEDPSYASIVRWGDEGDSFVVLEVKCAPYSHPRTVAIVETNFEFDFSVRNSPRPFYQSTSSIATLPVSFANSTNTISTRFAKTTRRMASHRMGKT